jgi:hypothetical protein
MADVEGIERFIGESVFIPEDREGLYSNAS